MDELEERWKVLRSRIVRYDAAWVNVTGPNVMLDPRDKLDAARYSTNSSLDVLR